MTTGDGSLPTSPRSVDLVVTAGVVVTVDAEDSVVEHGAVAIHDGVIVDVGTAGQVLDRVVPVERVDLPRHLLMPGFVNAHTHLSMTMFRGFTDDLDLAAFLGRIVPAEASMLDESTVTVGTRAAAVESLCGGVTTALDMYFFPDAALAVGPEVGLRVMSGPVVLDNEAIRALGPRALIDDPEPWLSSHPPTAGWRPVVGPHSVYTVAPDRLVSAGELAAAHDAVLHIHAAETAAEVHECSEAHGRRPVELLDDLGLLGPRSVLAHGVHLSDREIELLAVSGATVAHCPASNLKLASGVARVPDLLAAGVNVAIGTDGAATSNDLDMFVALRLTALLHKGIGGDPTVVPAHRALRMATIDGARALGMDAQLGSLEVGKLADLAAVDLDRPHLQPLFDPSATLVYAAGRGDVTDVWVGGEAVVRDRCPTRVDMGAVTADLAGLRGEVVRTLS